MIDTTEQTTCLACGKPLVQVEGRGHRKKLYCDDICRQRAHRRQAQSNVTPVVTNDDLQKRVVELERQLDEANDLLERLIDKKQSKQPLRRSYQERLTRKLEQLNWPALDIHIQVWPGRKEGRAFIAASPNDLLIRAIIAAERIEERRNQS